MEMFPLISPRSILGAILALVVANRLPAVEGCGWGTRGADATPGGAKVFRVVSLADDGPGTLREGLSEAGRRIVFDVAGEIELKSDLIMRKSYTTVDGTTAPAPGITIRQTGVTTAIEGSRSGGEVKEIIVRGLRFDARGTPHGSEKDILGLDGERAPVHHVLIENCTGNASGDGIFDVWGSVHDVTIAWNLITDTETALHLSTGDLKQTRERISFHHNLFARNNERQIRIRHANRDIEFFNNIVFGWGWHEWGGSGLHIAYDKGEINPSLAVIGNVFHFVPNRTAKPSEGIQWERGPDEGAVFFADNLLHLEEKDAISNISVQPKLSGVVIHSASSLAADLLPKVGVVHQNNSERELISKIGENLSQTSQR